MHVIISRLERTGIYDQDGSELLVSSGTEAPSKFYSIECWAKSCLPNPKPADKVVCFSLPEDHQIFHSGSEFVAAWLDV
jgi:hypothetical protein